MRLLHTSDWHLGRSFHREDMLSAQARFVDFLVETVCSERVDVVLVSGDVYDRALPGVDAVALCNDALTRLAATRARVVLISGNHDSATRLGFSSGLIDAAGIHLRTDPRRCDVPIVIDDPSGKVAVYAIPYLEPDAVRGVLDCAEPGHVGALRAAMLAVRQDLAGHEDDIRTVVLAHASVVGGQPSDSERDITVGGVSAVPHSLFDGIDYVALGHLHGAQRLTEHVGYSGSPLPYSFSEEHHRKGMWLVDLPGRRDQTMSVELIPTPVPRGLARLRGTLEQLLSDPAVARFADHYLHVTLIDPVRPRDAMERLRRRFPHTLILAFEPLGDEAGATGSYAARLRERGDIEIASDFVSHVRSAPEPSEVALLQQALEAVRQRGAAV